MKTRILFLLAIITFSLSGRLGDNCIHAQRNVDRLGRGVVAVKVNGGVFVSWRILGEEYYDVKYNLYRDGVLIAQNLSVSNYKDTAGSLGNKYSVSAVVRGVEQTKSNETTVLANDYLEVKMNHGDLKSEYVPNDASVADVDGDGEAELLIKFDNASDASHSFPKGGYQGEYAIMEIYKLSGERLWWIELGPNCGDFQNNENNIIAYDWDKDGKAEVVFRAADGTKIHQADGTVTVIGDPTKNYRGDTNTGQWFIHEGSEFLLYVEGATGKPYKTGTDKDYIDFPLPRGKASDWGDDYGHRSSKYFFGAPYLDGRNASLLLARGIYTKHMMIAMDVDPSTHKLKTRWTWNCNTGGAWYGQGYHNYSIADVDWDGRDEIVFGSMVIDDNGKGLSTSGLGHGDAHHVGDFDPYTHGQEFFGCNESQPANNYKDATTSKIRHRLAASGDDGRAIAGNFCNTVPGAMAFSAHENPISCVTNNVESNLTKNGVSMNYRIYWDGDLQEESMDGAATNGNAVINKYDVGTIKTLAGSMTNNDTKKTPCFMGDIFGDWREEMMLRTAENNVRIYTTTDVTKWRNYTLWHDHQYRNGMVWQMCGYNQPPHVSYFLGEMEDITVAPPPLIMTDRREIANGGSVTGEGEDIILCETNDMTVNVSDNASPHLLIDNAPSWIQGTAPSEASGKNFNINYKYFTHSLEGGSLTGGMRLIKQGDGILNMSKVVHTYSGNTDIWAGTLNFDGELKNSRVWLNRFAKLNSEGSFGKSIEMDYAAELRPGGADKKGEITIADTLILSFGSRLVFDVYGENLSSDLVKTGTLRINVKTWSQGPEYLAPVFEIVAHKTNGASVLAQGEYKLVETNNIIGSVDKIILKGLSTQKAYLEKRADGVYLIVEGLRDAARVEWKGDKNGVWDFATTRNFTDADGEEDFFVAGDDAVFNDNAQQYSVTLNGELPADSVIVDNTKSYTFQGEGSLIQNSQLIKQSSGTLTIKTNNSYTGGNHLKGGTVSVSALANDITQTGNLGGKTTNANLFTIEDGATLLTSSAVTNASPIKMVGEAGGVINNSNDFVMNASFSGTLLTKKGAGWMKLYAENTNLNRLVIQGGTVDAGVGTPAKTVELQSGAINLNASSGCIINIPQGKTASVYCTADRGVYSNKLTGSGTVTISYPLVKGSGWNATRAEFNGDWSAFEGTVKVASTDAEQFCLNNSYGMAKATLNIPSGYNVTTTGKTFKISAVTGTGNLANSSSLSSGSVGNTTWQVGNDDKDFSFEGKVTGSPVFQKTGKCKMTAKGKWDTAGSVAVNAGELHIQSGVTLGTGALTVAKDARFTGVTGTTGALSNSAYTINGTLQVGVLDNSATGIMNMGGKNVTFSTSGILRLGINKCATASNTGGASLKNISTLTMNGTIELFLGSSASLQAGDSIRLWTEVTTFKGTPRFSFPAGYQFDTSRIAEGLLYVTLADGIASVSDRKSTEDRMFDISGKRIKKASQTPGNIYIENGRKRIIKN